MSEFKYIVRNPQVTSRFEETLKLEMVYQLKRIADNLDEIKDKIKYNVPVETVNKDEPATEKQVWKLKQLGKFKEGITKQEAFKIIKESKK